tara:strand:+ start:7672 stop:7992 length:321 start_codon:yes stop_codon:yes gene_type:complete
MCININEKIFERKIIFISSKASLIVGVKFLVYLPNIYKKIIEIDEYKNIVAKLIKFSILYKLKNNIFKVIKSKNDNNIIENLTLNHELLLKSLSMKKFFNINQILI